MRISFEQINNQRNVIFLIDSILFQFAQGSHIFGLPDAAMPTTRIASHPRALRSGSCELCTRARRRATLSRAPRAASNYNTFM